MAGSSSGMVILFASAPQPVFTSPPRIDLGREVSCVATDPSIAVVGRGGGCPLFPGGSMVE